MDINIALKNYIKSKNNDKEKKTVESFIKQNRSNKLLYNKKIKPKNVNFIDEIDKNKNVAEVIYIKSYKEANKLENEHNNNEMNIQKTNETVKKNCTCNIF